MNLRAELRRRRGQAGGLAVATVVATWGSAPEPVGAKMIVGAGGDFAGSVSGGCVEGAVMEAAAGILAGGPAQRLAFRVADDVAWDVGLPCGGEIEVWIEDAAAWESVMDVLATAEAGRVAAAVAWPLAPGGEKVAVTAARGAAASRLDRLPRLARRQLAQGRPRLVEARELHGPADAFIDVFAPPPRLIIVGASHVAQALVPMARGIGFHITIVDPRRAFATRERFPDVDELVVEWPDRALGRLGLDADTWVVVLSHDEKIDVPALATALPSPVAYVACLGSRRTQARREAALAEAGVDSAAVARMRGPAGLDIGAIGAAEIAVSIAAEIVASRRGRLPDPT